jgi:hypothetical protein
MTPDPSSGVISFDGTENEEYFNSTWDLGSGVMSFGGSVELQKRRISMVDPGTFIILSVELN